MLQVHAPLRCPRCTDVLQHRVDSHGESWRCESCLGRFAHASRLRSWAHPEFVRRLEPELARAAAARGLRCPGCRGAMRRAALSVPSGSLDLDLCGACAAVWFDRDEVRRLKATDSPGWLGQNALDVLPAADPDSAGWKAILVYLGLPVEDDAGHALARPWVTWSLAGAIALVSMIAFADLPRAARLLGFVPADPFRNAGATLVAAFFLHAGWLHLLGNLYFLVVFGDDVEHELGRLRYAVLLLGAVLLGHALHTLADPGSTLPCIGASGGISGVLAFYAFALPLRRVFVAIRWWILAVSARVAFALWIGLQLLGAALQLQGLSSVSAFAHLGGVLAGIGGWWKWQKAL